MGSVRGREGTEEWSGPGRSVRRPQGETKIDKLEGPKKRDLLRIRRKF